MPVDVADAVGDQYLQASSHEFPSLVAKQRFGSKVREDDLAVAIDRHDALGSAFEEGSDTGLAASDLRAQLLLLRNISGNRLTLGWLAILIAKDLINPQVPTYLPSRPDDPMLQYPRRIVAAKLPDVLQDSRAVHLRDERKEGPVDQLVASFAKISTVSFTDECEDAVRTPAAHEALVLGYGAMPLITPGGISGGSLLGSRTTQFSELPTCLSELGHELLFALVFVPHAAP
jgi:hypothetical protein